MAAEQRGDLTAGAVAACCRETAHGTLLRVRLMPRASRSRLAGVQDGALRVRVAAPPVEGKANAALLDYLADRLGLRPRDLEIASGQRSRAKTVRITGLDGATLAARLIEGRSGGR